jgi:hypothetical protein
VRHGRTDKQRVWLGWGRYRGGCGDAVTNHDPDSDANSNRYAFCMRADNAYTYANSYRDGDRHGNSDRNNHGDSDRHANSYCNSHGDGDSDYHANCQPHCNSIDNSHAATDANTQVAPNGQATRNTADTRTIN